MSRDEIIDQALDRWGWGDAVRSPLAGDASFRRYERVRSVARGSAVLMDAPPADGEDVIPFVDVAQRLRAAGFSAPEILSAAPRDGLLLLEDLGDAIVAKVVEDSPHSEAEIYENAIDVLADVRRRGPTIGAEKQLRPIAPYDAATLADEAALFVDWWTPAARGAPLDAGVRRAFLEAIVAACAPPAADRSTLVLRDYHAENLIWLPDRSGAARIGLLDFQDALIGAPAYDVVSLLEDARRDVPAALAVDMRERFAVEAAIDDRSRYAADCAALGAQRALKIVGIFARLAIRDGKPRYLNLIPRVWAHLQRALSHPDLADLARWMDANATAPDAGALARVADRAADRAAVAAVRPPDAAFVLAAGEGRRMRPLTDTIPKPLLPVRGRPLLARALDRAAAAGASRLVTNARHLGAQIHAFAAARGDVEVSDEADRPLETGGGVVRALPRLGDRFLILNGDALWIGAKPLSGLVSTWRSTEMDALLLLSPLETAIGYSGPGDFFLEADGRLRRRSAAPRAPYLYCGAAIMTARAFDDAPSGAFSLNVVWDRLIAAGRAFGALHRAGAIDVGTPERLALAEQALRRLDAPLDGE